MKKNTVKKINIVFVSLMLALTVFFCSFGGYATAFASTGLTFDCPDCTDGTCLGEVTRECTVDGCVDGDIDTIVSSTCNTCSGESVVYSSTTSTCSSCNGLGVTYYRSYNSSDDCYRYFFSSCSSCCNTTWSISSRDQDNEYTEAAFVAYCISRYETDYGYEIGTGTVTTVTSADCPDCTDGNTYTTVTTDCTTCVDGYLTTTETITCPTCDGETTIFNGIDNISTIPTILKTENTDITVTFSYDELGDAGDLEFIWYLNNTAYKVTDVSSLTLSELPLGVYGMYCEINSSLGFTTTTNQFEVHVNPDSEVTYIQITEQPSSYTIKQGQAVSIELDEENAENIAWYVNDVPVAIDVMEIDLSSYEIGVYEIYCDYTIEEESFTSDVATVSIVNDEGLTEELETAWDNVVNGFWIAIGAGLATALLAFLAVKFSKK